MKNITSSIKTKLQLSFLTLILLSGISGLLFYKVLDTILTHEELKGNIDQMVSLFAEARKQEKDFILYERKELSFLEEDNGESLQKHAQAVGKITELLQEITKNEKLDKQEEISLKIQTIKRGIKGYETTFSELVKGYKTRGFKDHGLEGDMREVIHQLQECESKEEQWFALMLRRHEKDFFLRQDKKYIITLHKRAQEFIDFVKTADLAHMNPEYKKKTVASIQNYVHHFNRIASIEKEIGLSKKEGLIGNLNEQAEFMEPLLAQVQQLIYEKNQKLVGNSFLILLASGALMLGCGIAFSFLLAKKISHPIIQLSKLVENASIGDESTSRSLAAMKRKDELGKLVKSFGNVFKEINLKVQEISEKNVVLQQAAQKEKERTWFTEGVSLFEGIMATHADNLSLLCDEFLLKLVKYTDSKQAALFLKEKDERDIDFMRIQSCYAHDKKRYVKKSIEIGEGLVGAVWQEKEPFYMNDIPETYSKIRSGLGQAKPTAIFLVPVVSENEVEAVVELGAFKEFSENEKALILQVCKGLAGAVSRARLQEQTQLLLQQANTLTEELKQNEEEIRQHLEEQQATREELEKNQQSMQEEVDRLQKRLRTLSGFVDFNYKGVLITDEDFNLVYRNEYWQQLFGSMETSEKQKINQLLNLSEKELSEAIRHQHEVLLSQLNRNMLLAGAGGETAFKDLKIAEYTVDQRNFYSILTN